MGAPTETAGCESSLAISRRDFLVGAAAVLLLSGTAVAQTSRAAPIVLNAWLRITPDDVVSVILAQSEMGQGISTTLPAALADELGADWSRLQSEWADFDPAYRHPQYEWMFTGNS
jgi:isoquinoline 1-oxidoreductase beta subunit